MYRSKFKAIQFCVILCICTFLFLYYCSITIADVFCVSTDDEFRTALSTAYSNGEDDEIHVVQGKYYGAYTAWYPEGNKLSIKGGYIGSDCAARILDPLNTVIDANSDDSVFKVHDDFSADFEFDGITFQNGAADNSAGGGLSYHGQGNVILSNNIFNRNNSVLGGGGVVIASEGSISLSNNTISNNTSTGGGGGVYIGSVDSIVFFNNTISNNNSTGGGGGVYITDVDSISFSNNTISSNITSAGGSGGGVYIDYSDSISLSNNIISDNTSAGGGGGLNIWLCETITLNTNIISKNTSDTSGGGVNINSIVSNQGAVFQLDFRRGKLIMNSNRINGNRTNANCGGVYLYGLKTISLTNNILHDNYAEQNGGAAGIYDTYSTKLISNTIVNNQGSGLGAGILIVFYNYHDSADLYNNIIYGNYGCTQANDINIVQSGGADGIYPQLSLLGNNFDHSSDGTYIDMPFTIDPSNLDNQDPLFVNPMLGNYLLEKDSPCIDAGASKEPTQSDFQGTLRPQGDGYDIGAYEYKGVPEPDIKANGFDEEISIFAGDSVSIELSLDGDNLPDLEGDWWVVEISPDNTIYSYDTSTFSMPEGLSPAFQGSLQKFDLSPIFESSYLSVGRHTFYFGIDMNVNGSLDIDALFYDSVVVNRECTDADGDGYFVDKDCAEKIDCNDGDAAINPGAAEICDDGIDQNCDERDCIGNEMDDDGDGFTENEGDCNDADSTINPNAVEIQNDGIDQDCNGSDKLSDPIASK